LDKDKKGAVIKLHCQTQQAEFLKASRMPVDSSHFSPHFYSILSFILNFEGFKTHFLS
jgi:hypothetical protein